MNKQIMLHNKALLLKNILNRMTYNKGQRYFRLDGKITPEERNALYMGLQLIDRERRRLSLEGEDNEERTLVLDSKHFYAGPSGTLVPRPGVSTEDGEKHRDLEGAEHK